MLNASDIPVDQKAYKYIYECVETQDNYGDKIALVDGKNAYSYNQLFQNVEKYASVFSALKMNFESNARVGLIGSCAAETIFSVYALNMVGAEVSLISSLSNFNVEKIMQVVKNEHLTDLILPDDFLQAQVLYTLIQKKDALGLRFILLLHVPVCGCTVPAPLSESFEQKANIMRSFWGILYMDYLIGLYGNQSITYCENASCETAFIIHTSGTTGGSGKPIVMSDRAFNFMSRSISGLRGYECLKKEFSTALLVDLSNAYGIIVQIHMPLTICGKIILVPGNALNPLFFNVISKHRISVLFCNSGVIEMWMKFSDGAGLDFSSLKCVVFGGSAVTVEDKKRYRDFLMKHGCGNIPVLNGYGISELGGVCTLSSEDINDEAIGYLLDGFEARFFDEDTHEFKTVSNAPCTGVLYLNSPSMACIAFDGKETVKSEMIDGKPFICSNDLVSVDSTGKITYMGRANRYFLNNGGIKYQSGRVEMEFSRQYGIKSCGLLPVFDKPIHDNIPMLCVTTFGGNELEIIRRAFLNIFKIKKTLGLEQMPLRILLAKELPRNANGKLDLFKINNGQVEGIKYVVSASIFNGELLDVIIKKAECEDENIVREVYKGIAKDLIGASLPGNVFNHIKQNYPYFQNPGFTNGLNQFYQMWCYNKNK